MMNAMVTGSRKRAFHRARKSLANRPHGPRLMRDGAPRINLGPCGRFARDFRARWNARFRDPVTIAFIMSNDGATCHHVLVKLPDGRYFDGGNGVVTDTALMRLFS